jgi:hypothetical protein
MMTENERWKQNHSRSNDYFRHGAGHGKHRRERTLRGGRDGNDAGNLMLLLENVLVVVLTIEVLDLRGFRDRVLSNCIKR